MGNGLKRERLQFLTSSVKFKDHDFGVNSINTASTLQRNSINDRIELLK